MNTLCYMTIYKTSEIHKTVFLYSRNQLNSVVLLNQNVERAYLNAENHSLFSFLCVITTMLTNGRDHQA